MKKLLFCLFFLTLSVSAQNYIERLLARGENFTKKLNFSSQTVYQFTSFEKSSYFDALKVSGFRGRFELGTRKTPYVLEFFLGEREIDRKDNTLFADQATLILEKNFGFGFYNKFRFTDENFLNFRFYLHHAGTTETSSSDIIAFGLETDTLAKKNWFSGFNLYFGSHKGTLNYYEGGNTGSINSIQFSPYFSYNSISKKGSIHTSKFSYNFISLDVDNDVTTFLIQEDSFSSISYNYIISYPGSNIEYNLGLQFGDFVYGIRNEQGIFRIDNHANNYQTEVSLGLVYRVSKQGYLTFNVYNRSFEEIESDTTKNAEALGFRLSITAKL